MWPCVDPGLRSQTRAPSSPSCRARFAHFDTKRLEGIEGDDDDEGGSSSMRGLDTCTRGDGDNAKCITRLDQYIGIGRSASWVASILYLGANGSELPFSVRCLPEEECGVNVREGNHPSAFELRCPCSVAAMEGSCQGLMFWG